MSVLMKITVARKSAGISPGHFNATAVTDSDWQKIRKLVSTSMNVWNITRMNVNMSA